MTSAPALRSAPSFSPSSARRGECPTLQRPMQTGDGLLARLRPTDNMLTLPQVRALAEAAARHGNGIVEITARGSLQIRGLKPETVAPFERAVFDAGIDVSTGVGIETPPLAGLDPQELVDMRPVAEALRLGIAEHVPPLVLAPKLAITLDGGGQFHLGDVAADIKVSAFRDGEQTRFLISAGGAKKLAGLRQAEPRAIAIVEQNDIVESVVRVLKTLSSLGPAARGKDIDLDWIHASPIEVKAAPLLGIHSLSGPTVPDAFVLGIVFAYRQANSDSLIALADAAEAYGAGDIRLAPGHGLFITGLTSENARALQQAAAELGFLTRTDDPRQHISLCAGSRGCASAFYETQALALRLLDLAPDLLDGSASLHLSGCSKGCAHPAASTLAFVGSREGYGLVVNGAASALPATYIADNHIDVALQRLQALVRQSKENGETALACLTRLGAADIAAALQLDRT